MYTSVERKFTAIRIENRFRNPISMLRIIDQFPNLEFVTPHNVFQLADLGRQVRRNQAVEFDSRGNTAEALDNHGILFLPVLSTQFVANSTSIVKIPLPESSLPDPFLLDSFLPNVPAA